MPALRPSRSSWLLGPVSVLVLACGPGVVSGSEEEAVVDTGEPPTTTSTGAAGSSSSTTGTTTGAGGSGIGMGAGGSLGEGGSGPTVIVAAKGPAATIASKLGRSAHFLIGLGNHADDNYTVQPPLDLNYVYLVGMAGANGWPDWEKPSGAYLSKFAVSAQQHNVVPFFTVYGMAGWGDGNIWAVNDHAYMQSYWSTIKLMFQKIAEFGGPAVVHFEPDFWGYTQNQEPDAAKFEAKVSAEAPDCASLANNMVGMGNCLVKLARMYAPKAVIGFQASNWSGKPADAVRYLSQIGANTADIIVVETLDRDAGCFEVGTNPACKRAVGNPYWDDKGFRDHLAWAKEIGDGLGKPIMWWQMPLGVPSTSPGTSGHYRDNRASWLFAHTAEFVAAGGVGAVFGVGADHQTTLSTDGGQFQKLSAGYLGSPAQLP